MNTLIISTVVAAALGSALVGGIFFAFSNFVMKALSRLPDSEGIAAMQSINIVVLNRWFLGIFMGTAVICLALFGIAIFNWDTSVSPWMLGGAVSYVAGTWLVTIAGNVPLNEELAHVDPLRSSSARVWERYLEKWTALNSKRAWAAMFASLLFIIGLIV